MKEQSHGQTDKIYLVTGGVLGGREGNYRCEHRRGSPGQRYQSLNSEMRPVFNVDAGLLNPAESTANAS